MISLQTIGIFITSFYIIPRLTFLPPTIRQLSPAIGPFVLPRLISAIHALRSGSSRNPRVPLRPVPIHIQRALNLLFFSTIIWLGLSSSYFAEENIFARTESRLQTAPDVLFTRLRLLRPLNAGDEVLRAKFKASGVNKLLYLVYGPDTLVNCTWCTTATPGVDAGTNYFLYALPKLVTPHIFNLLVLGIATSSLIGIEGARFRNHVTIAGLVLLATEAWLLFSYDVEKNKKAVRLGDIDFYAWRLRTMRYIAFSVLHSLLALLLWATSTNRFLARPISLAERLEVSARGAEESLNKLRALGLLVNSVNRDKGLREVKEGYWQEESAVMSEVVQEESVREEINRVVGKMDLVGLEGQAGGAADALLKGIEEMGVGGRRRAGAEAGTGTGAGDGAVAGDEQVLDEKERSKDD